MVTVNFVEAVGHRLPSASRGRDYSAVDLDLDFAARLLLGTPLQPVYVSTLRVWVRRIPFLIFDLLRQKIYPHIDFCVLVLRLSVALITGATER